MTNGAYFPSPKLGSTTPKQRPIPRKSQATITTTQDQLNLRSPSLRAVRLASPRSVATSTTANEHGHVEMDIVFHEILQSPRSTNSATWHKSPLGVPQIGTPLVNIHAHDYDDIEDDDIELEEMDDLVLDVKIGSGESIRSNVGASRGSLEIANERFTFASLSANIADLGTSGGVGVQVEGKTVSAPATSNITNSEKAPSLDVNQPSIPQSSIDTTHTLVNASEKPTVQKPQVPRRGNSLLVPKKFKWFSNVKPLLQSFKSGSTPDLFRRHPSKSDMLQQQQQTSITTQKESHQFPQCLSLLSDHIISSKEKKHEYKQLKILGHGVQGTVSLRLHVPTGSIVALKSMSTTMSPVDSNVRASFRQEVDILQQTRKHPNVIRLLDFWEGKQKVYQVFEVCSGGDLDTGLKNAVAEDEAVRLIAPIMDAVRFLHELGILHRDIRPPNVFFRRPLTGHESLQELMTIPVLADFGIATYAKFSGRMGTQFPTRPAYIAPEVVDGERFRRASDVYQVGTCLVKMLFGRLIELSDQNPRSLGMVPEFVELSVEGQMFLKRCLEVDPVKRITAREAVDADWFHLWGVEIVGPVVEKVVEEVR
ncbi:UNVERIFIED_CONTAM: hypothetical protein HDU68_002992 [Siphonaria sp. JEL0065]|nr:hypothetical protein HDU68_002992 [Siphonaria sp. JEL0065]